MLIEFTVSNFRSFGEEQKLNLVANKTDKEHPGNLIECEKFDLLKAAVVYGANASGKSNLVKALAVMQTLVRSSATIMSLGDWIPNIVPFLLDTEYMEEPTLFEVVVLIEGTRYRYGFSVTKEKVLDEWLRVCRPKGRESTWLDRQYDSKLRDWDIKGPLRKDKKLLQEKTRDNGLVLSRGAELNIEPLANLFMWFRRKLSIYDLSKDPESLMQYTANATKNNKKIHEKVLHLVQDADFGIRDIHVSEKQLFEMLDDAPKKVKEKQDRLNNALAKFLKEAGGNSDEPFTTLDISTSHRINGTDKHTQFNLRQDESQGTQRFFALAVPLLKALDLGEPLFLDEFDCSLHPQLSRKLIELFQDPEINKSGAQLIFTTHDTTLMDSTLFRRDQVWLTEKMQSGATDLYSLNDFSTKDGLRNNTRFEKQYLEGRYGGIPKFGPSLEMLEVE